MFNSNEYSSDSVTSSTKEHIFSEETIIPSKLASIAFYIFLFTIIVSPLVFLPTPYIALEAIKTIFIALGTLVSAILYSIIAYKEKKIILPPKGVLFAGVVVCLSIIISSYKSLHPIGSFFGQGFELNTASFSILLFFAALVMFTAIYQRVERVTVVYIGIVATFLIFVILHGLRFIFGPSFATLGGLSNITSTFIGTWYDLASYISVVGIILAVALVFLPLSRRIKSVYWLLLGIVIICLFVVNSFVAWVAVTIVFACLTVQLTLLNPKSSGNFITSNIRRIAWIPLFIFVIVGMFAWKGVSITGTTVSSIVPEYTSQSLPWRASLDVAAGSIKNNPIFGIGPNQFSKAYMVHKPIAINNTNVWSVEFNYAVSLFSTFISTQGVFGMLAWGLFLLVLLRVGIYIKRNIPQDPYARFIIVSSSSSALFLWIISILSVPSHVILFYTYIMTAIAVATGVYYGCVKSYKISPRIGARSHSVLSLSIILIIIITIVWGTVYIKNAVAFVYFSSGLKQFSYADPVAADILFSKAQHINNSDVYLRARAGAGIEYTNQLIAQANASKLNSTTTQALIDKVVATVDSSIKHAQNAVVYDPTNYYNHVSEARVSELASNIKMDKAYENAVSAYTKAIKLNPFNPVLYLNLAQLQASQNKLDEALQNVGVALQVKNNYIEAIFLLSQITAAQGNLKDAITAAQVGTQINPQSPVLFFQLGLLQYTNKDYVNAIKSLENAVRLQDDYANAQYFLGLAYTRVGDISSAISQFELLVETNKDNQEVNFILNNLLAGKSPFADAQPPVTPTPEKRSTLPVKESKK